jgi:hypothetical protein
MPPALAMVTVAVPPANETETVMPLVAVVSEFPLVSSTWVPSMLRNSALVPETLVTESTSWSRLCPVSTVDAATPE